MSTNKDTLQGLQEMLEYIKGDKTKGRSKTVQCPDIIPVKQYSKDDIKSLRTTHNLSQRTFAQVIGVSPKTVEAWEAGTNKPSMIANRFFQIIEINESILTSVIKN